MSEPKTQVCDTCGEAKALDQFRVRRHGKMCMRCYNWQRKCKERVDDMPANVGKELRPGISQEVFETQLSRAIGQIDMLMTRAEDRKAAARKPK